MKEVKESSENKLDKQLVKSLLINYFTSPPELKKDVARLLVRILDFSESELIKCGLMTTSGQQQSVQQEMVQVASQFVQFLERESVPRNPVVAPPTPLSKTPSASSLVTSTSIQQPSRSSSSTSTASSTTSSGQQMQSNVNLTNTPSSSQPYKPAGPEAVKQLAKGLLHHNNLSGGSNPFTDI